MMNVCQSLCPSCPPANHFVLFSLSFSCILLGIVWVSSLPCIPSRHHHITIDKATFRSLSWSWSVNDICFYYHFAELPYILAPHTAYTLHKWVDIKIEYVWICHVNVMEWWVLWRIACEWFILYFVFIRYYGTKWILN